MVRSLSLDAAVSSRYISFSWNRQIHPIRLLRRGGSQRVIDRRGRRPPPQEDIEGLLVERLPLQELCRQQIQLIAMRR